MCGIAGIISNNPEQVTERRLRSMTDSINHRGPDGEGFWRSENGMAGFGHRRLSIIDLSAGGAQPMQYQGRYTITYNGEIYNYTELRHQLVQKGFAFRSACDTEVVLAAFACYGTDCLRYFDGMFAFAIWDDQTQTLFCARDRFGEKPFYYTIHDGQFLFASEMKALWAAGIPKVPNPSRLLTYLATGITANAGYPSQTFFSNINKLPSAHYLLLNSSQGGFTYSLKNYWDLDKETCSPVSLNEATEKFHHLLATSVQMRLRSDVAVGTSLSGGLDSSAIISAICAQRPAASPLTFSAVFPGFAQDEQRYITMVSNRFLLTNFSVSPSATDFINSFETLCYHQEEPFQSASIFAQYQVYKLARQHNVKVLLDGQGADETLAGYHSYYPWFWQELIARGKWRAAQKEISAAKAIGVNADWGIKNYAAAYLPGITANRLSAKAYWQQANNRFINQAFAHENIDRNSVVKPVVDKLNDILYFHTMQYGLEDLLRYADRNSMAHSVEVRLPFLEHQLVEFIFSLPATFKIHNGYTKYLLRQSMQNILPEAITWRKDKVGFEPPQQQWMQQPAMHDYMVESRKKLVKLNILNKGIIDKPFMAKSAHAADNTDWQILCAAQIL